MICRIHNRRFQRKLGSLTPTRLYQNQENQFGELTPYQSDMLSCMQKDKQLASNRKTCDFPDVDAGGWQTTKKSATKRGV